MISTRRIQLAWGSLLLVSGILAGTTGCATGTAGPVTPADGSVAGTVDTVVGGTTPDGTTILASATVGTSTFALGQRGADIRYAASFDGSDPDQNWETFGAPVELAPDDFTMVNPGNSPSAAPGGLAHVTGQVGSGVTALDVITDDGSTVGASMSGGYYVAAWEGMDFWDQDTLDAAFVLTLADGSSKTIGFREMSKD